MVLVAVTNSLRSSVNNIMLLVVSVSGLDTVFPESCTIPQGPYKDRLLRSPNDLPSTIYTDHKATHSKQKVLVLESEKQQLHIIN